MKEDLKYSAVLCVGAIVALGASYAFYPSNKPGAVDVAVASELRKTIDAPAPKTVVQTASAPVQATPKPEKPAYFCPIENTAFNVCMGLHAVNLDPSNWQRIKNGAQEVVDIAAMNCRKADLDEALIVGETAAKRLNGLAINTNVSGGPWAAIGKQCQRLVRNSLEAN